MATVWEARDQDGFLVADAESLDDLLADYIDLHRDYPGGPLVIAPADTDDRTLNFRCLSCGETGTGVHAHCDPAVREAYAYERREIAMARCLMVEPYYYSGGPLVMEKTEPAPSCVESAHLERLHERELAEAWADLSSEPGLIGIDLALVGPDRVEEGPPDYLTATRDIARGS